MWTTTLLARYLDGDPFEIVLEHSRCVAALALEVAGRLSLSEEDRLFIADAALLHDIGVCQVDAAGLGLHGGNPYIMHGVLGRAILEREGYPLHALVCERHTGVGLTCEDIVRQKLPLPQRDMCPQSLPEQIICFADLFYSKKPGRLSERKPVERVREKLLPFGKEKVAVFDGWLVRFGAE
ncbi:MAG: HD domain-containing protein [Desulfuromonadaceae bacterium]|nr:HD domain-containing protein [Desulfuromonadaceae bacterium]MDD2847061.1 HD domain-containing protein [Desulfuromonadaceae bacterium]MDD4128961.1 HD domain-containing protein [Desulfuromonadaceae bacterium]